MEVDTYGEHPSNWKVILAIGAVAVIGIGISVAMAYGTNVRYETSVERAQATHARIVETTTDASGGSDTVRIRQAPMTYARDGSCSITVQRYLRRTPDDLYAEPPKVETTAFPPSQCR